MSEPTTLLQTLRSVADSGREGLLAVRSAGGRHVELYAGRGGLRLVSSGRRAGVRIGEVLLRAGTISQRQLDLVLERQQKSNLRFGELLYLMCQITEDEIREAIRTQIQEEILDLAVLEDAACTFTEGPPPQSLFEADGPASDRPLPIAPMLEEAARRIAEWDAWGRRVPRPDEALTKAPPVPGKSELPLDDRTLQIVELCDGRRGVEQVALVSPKFRFETLKALAYLAGVGRIQAGGRVVAGATPTEMLKRDALGDGPGAEATATPGGAPEAVAVAAKPPAPPPSTRFGLEAVPDVDWQGARKASQAPAVEGETRSGTSTARPAAGFTDGPTYEPKPDTNPAAGPPPGYLKKEETSRLMTRNAAQAIAHRPPLLPPPELRRRSTARVAWLLAGLLFAALAGAASWEGLARRRFPTVDAAARAAEPAEARRLYEEFARDWPGTSPAREALRAARDLADDRAEAEAAEALRSFAAGRLDLLERLALEDEEAGLRAMETWAQQRGEAGLAGRCRDRMNALETYRAAAAVVLAEYRAAVKEARIAEARRAGSRLATEFPRAPQARIPVLVTTFPPGAAVEVGGVKAGPSPCVVEVGTGEALSCTALLDGHAPAFASAPAPLPETLRLELFRLERWQARASAGHRLPATATSAGIWLVPEDGTMLALSPVDGHTLWRVRAATHPWITAPVVARGAVLAGDQNGTVWALDAADGNVLWRESVGSGLRGAIAAASDGSAVFAAPAEGGVVSLDTATGSSLGRAELPGTVALGPFPSGATGWSVVLADGTVVSGRAERAAATAVLSAPCAAAAPAPAGLLCASTEGAVSLVASDGTVRWTAKNPGAVTGGVAAAGNRGVALLSKRRMACYDLESGGSLWTADLPAGASAPPTVGDALALVPCDDGLVRAFALPDGAARWTFRAGQVVRVRVTQAPGGAVVAAENGVVLFVP